MNYFKIVILSLLLSIHCGIQSSTLDDSDNDFFDNGALDQLIDRYIHYYEAEDQNILDQNNDMSQVSDHFDADNAVDNNFQDQQNNHNLITPKQAGKKAYDDVYSQLYKIDEPDDSENNKYARAQAEKARRATYHQTYRQLAKSKDVMEKREKKRWAMQHDGVPNLITPKQAGKKAYDDVYRQLYKIDEPDDSENNKQAIVQAEKARKVAYRRAYHQLAKSKDVMEKREKKRWAMQHDGVPNLITPNQAGKKAYDDVYRQLRRTNELDDSEHNKRAKAAATKARNVAYDKFYRQTEKGKAVEERRRQKRRAMQQGGISVNSQINLVDQPQLVEDSNNNGDNLYQNENIDDHFQDILNMNDDIDNEIDDLLNGLDPYELL